MTGGHLDHAAEITEAQMAGGAYRTLPVGRHGGGGPAIFRLDARWSAELKLVDDEQIVLQVRQQPPVLQAHALFDPGNAQVGAAEPAGCRGVRGRSLDTHGAGQIAAEADARPQVLGKQRVDPGQALQIEGAADQPGTCLGQAPAHLGRVLQPGIEVRTDAAAVLTLDAHGCRQTVGVDPRIDPGVGEAQCGARTASGVEVPLAAFDPQLTVNDARGHTQVPVAAQCQRRAPAGRCQHRREPPLHRHREALRLQAAEAALRRRAGLIDAQTNVVEAHVLDGGLCRAELQIADADDERRRRQQAQVEWRPDDGLAHAPAPGVVAPAAVGEHRGGVILVGCGLHPNGMVGQAALCSDGQ